MSLLALIICLMSGFSVSLYYIAIGDETSARQSGTNIQAHMLAESALEYAFYIWLDDPYLDSYSRKYAGYPPQAIPGIGTYQIINDYSTNIFGDKLNTNEHRFEVSGTANGFTSKMSSIFLLLPLDGMINDYKKQPSLWKIEAPYASPLAMNGYDPLGGINKTGSILAVNKKNILGPTPPKTVAMQYFLDPIYFKAGTVITLNYSYKTDSLSAGEFSTISLYLSGDNKTKFDKYSQQNIRTSMNWAKNTLATKIPYDTNITGFRIELEPNGAENNSGKRYWIDNLHFSGPRITKFIEYITIK